MDLDTHMYVFLLNIGCNSKYVAERIGDTILMIEKTYYHMLPDKKSITVKAINNFKTQKNLNKQQNDTAKNVYNLINFMIY